MTREPFWITDLHRGHPIEIRSPLSGEAEAFLREVQGTGTSSKTVEGRRIECRAHDGDPRLAEFRDSNDEVRDIWLYVQKRGTKWVLCHYAFHRKPSVRLGEHEIETEEHREIKDTWQWGLEAGGSCDQVIQEHRIGPRTFDVWVKTANGESMAIEVDHTTREVKTAQRKDDADRELGLAATVFCADRANPAYADRVAHTELQDKSFRQGRAHPRYWPITRGPRVVRFPRCNANGPWNRCPEKPPRSRGPRYCGGEHLFLTSWTDVGYPLTIADVGEQLPAGDLVVIRPGIQRVDACLVRAGDGRSAEEYLRQRIPLQRTPDAAVRPHQRVISPEEVATRQAERPTYEHTARPASEASIPAQRERIVVNRRDLRERCKRCGHLSGLAEGLCLLCRADLPSVRRLGERARAEAIVRTFASRTDDVSREVYERAVEEIARLDEIESRGRR